MWLEDGVVGISKPLSAKVSIKGASFVMFLTVIRAPHIPYRNNRDF